MVTMISSAMAMSFTCVSLILKHDHWALDTDEAKALGEAINTALDTLPEKYYEQITQFTENWFPWFNLCFVLAAILYPRIDESAKRLEERNYRENQNNAGRPGHATSTANDNPFNNWTGINQSL